MTKILFNLITIQLGRSKCHGRGQYGHKSEKVSELEICRIAKQ